MSESRLARSRSRPRRAVAFLAATAVLAGVGGVASADIDGPISEGDTTTLVSVAEGGGVPNHFSANPELSRDGRFVVFSSEASNLVPGDTNGRRDVFWRDRLTGETQLVSRADGADGAPGDANSGGDRIAGQGHHGISADGRYVVFVSFAANLVEDDTDDDRDVFVRDMVAHRTHLVSRADDDAVLAGSVTGGKVDISGDGRYVVFESSAENLPGTEGGDVQQVYRRDLIAGRTLLISRTAAGAPGDDDSRNAVISDDGTRIGFSTDAPALGSPLESDGFPDSVFVVRDVSANRTTVESRLDGRNGEIDTSFGGVISGDGSHIGWTDGNGSRLFVRNLATGATENAAVLTDGSPLFGNGCCWSFAISHDARYVAAYASPASGLDHVFHRDLHTGITQQVNRTTGADGAVKGSDIRAGVAISGDGRLVGFGSDAPDLAPGDTDNGGVFPVDVFVRDVLGPRPLQARITGGTQHPKAMSVRVGCGDAMCDAGITARVVVGDGAGQEVFEIEPSERTIQGGFTADVPLAFVDPASVSTLLRLLRSPAVRAKSRLEVALEGVGEVDAVSRVATFPMALLHQVVAPAIAVRVKPNRDRRAPYRFDIVGRLGGGFVRDTATCIGKVVLTVRKRGNVLTNVTRVKDDCTFQTTLKIRKRKARRKGLSLTRPTALRLVVTFHGNAHLKRATTTRRLIVN